VGGTAGEDAAGADATAGEGGAGVGRGWRVDDAGGKCLPPDGVEPPLCRAVFSSAGFALRACLAAALCSAPAKVCPWAARACSARPDAAAPEISDDSAGTVIAA
jgi:hypothetical protein